MSHRTLGIDIGALTVKTVLLEPGNRTPEQRYRFHHGNPIESLRRMLEESGLDEPLVIAVTGSGDNLVPLPADIQRIDSVRATIAGVRHLEPEAHNIIDIGGASLKLVRLDEQGRFSNYSCNSQCAAGTGSFLDEQSTRLGLSHERIAEFRSVEDPPPVATRCAVFAKSDLIHLQQSGVPVESMWSGLCRGMAQTALQTLLKGKPIGCATVLVGGVAQNREVLRWLRELADAPITTMESAHVVTALGAALLAQQNGKRVSPVDWREWLSSKPRRAPGAVLWRSSTACPVKEPCDEPVERTFASEHVHEPLTLRRTQYPSFEVLENTTDAAGNEIRLSRWPHAACVAGYLGVDIGSTSTKLCLIDARGDVLVDIYRKTSGDPIGATRKLFDALRETAAQHGSRLDILGCGTTGSGRKLVGTLIGADAIINEISAHVAGAMHVDPELETIFEIGGQDSKYMRTRNGRIVDSNMNYVCAAGTGSFVEEQARKLGVALQEVGDRVLGLVPPQTSDRCTVFMEQDVNQLLRTGQDADHALAAVMRSVVQNYLNKVVRNRHWSKKKIGFQGATARNKGLVAAFETLLGVEMVVSPYCHVMGAWGVALLTRDQIARSRERTSFLGLDLSQRPIELRKERCELCNNECELTFAHVEGLDHEPSWGYLCGRDPSDTRMRVHREFDLFRRQRRWLLREGAATVAKSGNGHRPVRVIMPRALTFFSHLPMWRRLLEELGAQVVLAPESNRSTRERGAALAGAEFCFPMKLAHGQVAQAFDVEQIDYVLAPRMVAQPRVGQQSDTWFCPYVQALPSVVETALQQAGSNTTRLLDPTLDRRLPEEQQVQALHRSLGPALQVSRGQVRRAYAAARETQAAFEARCKSAGQKALEELAVRGEKAIVVIGRPYNVTDTSANLDLPRKIAEMGYRVLPIELLPFEPEIIPPHFRNVYWAYGQRILSALELVRRNENLFAVYFTNFNCGPDSFLLSYAEEIMGEKPMLSLELDEHGADAGYITRIEAFLDVVRDWQPTTTQRPQRKLPEIDTNNLRDRRIWIPPMHPISAKLFAAAFRSEGYDAVALPNETPKDLELGQRHTRGCECLPMRSTIGCFLNAIATGREQEHQHALFMPTACGPCRFGQYATLDRMIFDQVGLENAAILSPSWDSSYLGLSSELRRSLWKALVASDMLAKLTYKTRPYEATTGAVDQALEDWRNEAARALENNLDVRDVVRRAGEAFQRIPLRQERKPLVGIVGEIYVRNNVFSNEDLVGAVERAGGEAWVAPIPEWILFTTWQDMQRHARVPRTLRHAYDYGSRRLRLHLMQKVETDYWKAAGPLLADRHEPEITRTIRAGQHYTPFNVGGEMLLSLGRASHFIDQGVALVVNASPFGCMAGTVAAALFSRLEKERGVPVVNLFYEGTGGTNEQLKVFLANLNGNTAQPEPAKRSRSNGAGALRSLPELVRSAFR